MRQSTAVKQSRRAAELAEMMLDNEKLMRTILDETLTSASNGDIREAGRTICPSGGEVRGPLNRFPRAIDLASCPIGVGGTWHTHVTPHEIRNPVNSLPDMANVVYGLTNVSIVVGTRTADVMVSAEDDDAAVDTFRNAIGADVSGPADISDAIKAGRVMPSPARNRARDHLDTLIYTAETGYDDLDRAVADIPPDNWAAPFGSGRDEEFSGNRAKTTAFAPDAFSTAGEEVESLIGTGELRNTAISTAIGTIVGGIVSRIVFGDD